MTPEEIDALRRRRAPDAGDVGRGRHGHPPDKELPL
jgi:hypothetical protein